MCDMSRSESAEHFRRVTRGSVAAMSAEERVRRALALGELCLTIFASANGLSIQGAREELRARQDAARRRAQSRDRSCSPSSTP
jgi:hypothetical protein